MRRFITKLFASLDNHSVGYSGRKLSALATTLTAIYIATTLLPETDRIYGVYACFAYAAVCLGLVTIPQLIEFLSGKKPTNEPPKE